MGPARAKYLAGTDTEGRQRKAIAKLLSEGGSNGGAYDNLETVYDPTLDAEDLDRSVIFGE